MMRAAQCARVEARRLGPRRCAVKCAPFGIGVGLLGVRGAQRWTLPARLAWCARRGAAAWPLGALRSVWPALNSATKPVERAPASRPRCSAYVARVSSSNGVPRHAATLRARAACQQRSPTGRSSTPDADSTSPATLEPRAPTLQARVAREQRSPTARANRSGLGDQVARQQQHSPTAGSGLHGPGRTSPATVRRGPPVW